jgi:hypothetical protein
MDQIMDSMRNQRINGLTKSRRNSLLDTKGVDLGSMDHEDTDTPERDEYG